MDLFEKMGYGTGETTGRGGDGGVDGIIYQDSLGMERVYIQAKRYISGQVGSREIRDFIGSLDTRSAHKGVFITTSNFTNDAQETDKGSSKLVRLVNGQELARLMIRRSVGVITRQTYSVQQLDENYFAQE